MSSAPREFSQAFASILSAYRMGDAPPRHIPLDRYLPMLPQGMVTRLAKADLPHGGWIFDPFGLSPSLDLELAGSGFSVLVCQNNPILNLLLELQAEPPTREEVVRCSALVAGAMKGSQRLEVVLQKLYESRCRNCGMTLPADAYLWEKGAATPYATQIDCPNCGTRGEFAWDEVDAASLALATQNNLPAAWAIEKIAAREEAIRDEAEEVVNSHLPRALYFIFTAINKIQTLELTAREKKIISGILLDVLDDATPIHQIGHSLPRPRQFLVPVRFHEHNLWKSFEQSAIRWQQKSTRLPIAIYPELPDGAGICLYRGRIRELAEESIPADIQAVLTVLPRPQHAFWTLSAVWSAWLFGREEASRISMVINRRRYDWNWHTHALVSTIQAIDKACRTDIPIHALMPEVEPSYIWSGFTAFQRGGFACSGFALHAEDEIVQTMWARQGTIDKPPGNRLVDLAQSAVIKYLDEKAEPADYLEMSTAAILGISQQAGIPDEAPTTTLLSQVKTAFANPILFRHYGGGEQTQESGTWMLKNTHPGMTSQMDRIEAYVVQMLAGGESLHADQLEERIYREIKPIFSPIRELLQHILGSYAEEDTNLQNQWLIRVNEHPALRSLDQQTIRGMLDKLGSRMGMTVNHREHILEWVDPQDASPLYRFVIVTHARLTELLANDDGSVPNRVLVIPGSRSNLIVYKRKTNPWLAEALEEWHLLKFRHVTRLVDNPMLTRESFDLLLDNDPPEYQPMQMVLL